MVPSAFRPSEPSSKTKRKQLPAKKEKGKRQKQPSIWDQLKNLLISPCKELDGLKAETRRRLSTKDIFGYSKLSARGGEARRTDNNHGSKNSDKDNSPESYAKVGQEMASLILKGEVGSVSDRISPSAIARLNNGIVTTGCSWYSRGVQFGKLSGCDDCGVLADPSRYLTYTPRPTICVCSQCGEVFAKIKSLEIHQAVRHAVSELGADDSSRTVIEMIFKSSWLMTENPVCKIERILKVHNTQRTIHRFEDCRDMVRTRALASPRKNPRCIVDGNELLRFYCTTIACTLGSHGSTSLCDSVPGCGVCTVIRHGFQGQSVTSSSGKGVRTTASSGRAHDFLKTPERRRAMLVCRVIAGRIKHFDDKPSEEDGFSTVINYYDSATSYTRTYPNLEELFVYNPKAILPCFVVIYKAR